MTLAEGDGVTRTSTKHAYHDAAAYGSNNLRIRIARCKQRAGFFHAPIKSVGSYFLPSKRKTLARSGLGSATSRRGPSSTAAPLTVASGSGQGAGPNVTETS